MEYEIVPGQEQARLETLRRCLMQIEEGKKRGRDAMRQIAEALTTIDEQQLYLDAGYNGLYEFCEGELRLDRFAAYRLMSAGQTVQVLEDGGCDQIPALESQLVLLHKIPPSELLKAWNDALIAMEQSNIPVTTTSIKRLVTHWLRSTSPTSVKGVNPKLSMDAQKAFSEEAELALERIGRIAGADVREAIENGALEISEREMIRWAQEDDAMLKSLAHYIVELGWSLGKAKAYEETMVTGSTMLSSLARLAAARGGRYESETVIDNFTWGFQIFRV